MPARRLGERTLAFYQGLAEELLAGHLLPDEVISRTRQIAGETSAIAEAIEWLRTEAEARIPSAPREGWGLAHVAHAAAQDLGDESLEAGCALTLAEALNTRGEFKPAIRLARHAADVFLAHGQPAAAVRCHLAAALASTELRQPQPALDALARARALASESGPPDQIARCDRLDAQVKRYQGRRDEAMALLERARKTFEAAEMPLDVVRCDLELARVFYLQDPSHALELADRAGDLFRQAGHLADAALCDHYRALALQELNRYPEALDTLERTRTFFTQQGMDHFVALADAALGIIYWRQNDYAAALVAHQRARDHFAAQDIPVWVAMCDVNLALVHYSLNRYAEAVALYSRAAEIYRRENLPVEAARCQGNMGLAYQKLGLYDRALALHQRARHVFEAQGLGIYVATWDENIGDSYCALHQYDRALEHYRQAREGYRRHGLPIYVARCETYLSDAHVATGRFEAARACLERAREEFEAAGIPDHVAACERRLARVHTRLGETGPALALLARARDVFTHLNLTVDAAVCDLEAGQVYVAAGDVEAAEERFNSALAILAPGFPDQAWRVHQGLGRCAHTRGKPQAALTHYLSAVQMVSQIRMRLPTEQLSSGLFVGRRDLYESALALALELAADEEALIIIEASKAQTLLSLVGLPSPGWQKAAQHDAYIRQLVEREQALRTRLATMRGELTLQEPGATGPLVRNGGEPRHDQREELAKLARLVEDYEEVLERLRGATPHIAEVQGPAAFSLPGPQSEPVERLREVMARHFRGRWAALEYYMLSTSSADILVAIYIDDQHLVVRTHSLDTYDRLVLRQCTASEPDFRELVYRGTLRGQPASHRAGPNHLRHLYRLLIPPEVEALNEDDLLILVPHGRLHGLPFAALLSDAGPLVARVPLVYTPSLKVLEVLMQGGQDANERRSRGAPPHLRTPAPLHPGSSAQLVCGVSDFGNRARPLPWAEAEIQAVKRVFGNTAHMLEGEAATVQTFNRLDAAGELETYDVFHFATHAILDHVVPTQSRLMLADDDLTAADILGLGLRARLVTLSACDSALGHLHPGDEMMGLVQAFFLAGARTVVASLWPVEDASAGEFMGRFYAELRTGQSVARALRQAQLSMHHADATLYQWAPLIAIGCP